MKCQFEIRLQSTCHKFNFHSRYPQFHQPGGENSALTLYKKVIHGADRRNPTIVFKLSSFISLKASVQMCCFNVRFVDGRASRTELTTTFAELKRSNLNLLSTQIKAGLLVLLIFKSTVSKNGCYNHTHKTHSQNQQEHTVTSQNITLIESSLLEEA